MRFGVLLIFLGVTMLVGCGGTSSVSALPITSPSKHDGYYKVGKPYKIKGRWYKPKHDPNYDSVGVASWYGPGFHGKMTANGSTYDKRALTAAHLTLPMPCMVRVTNMENGRSVIVMINDRGPYPKGKYNRIIDLSERAAELLNMKQKGTAKVRVTYLKDETSRLYAQVGIQHDLVTPVADDPHPPIRLASRPWKNPDAGLTPAVATAASSSSPSIISKAYAKEVPEAVISPLYVQVGAYRVKENALAVAEKCKRLGGIDIQAVSMSESDTLYRVRVGPLTNNKSANHLLKSVMEKGFHNAVIVQD